MDEVQRTVATDGLCLHDGMGNPAGHKRGYVFGGNVEHDQRAVDAYDERTAAYAAYVQRLTSAWCSPAAAAERNEAQLEAWRKPGARPGLRQDATNDSTATSNAPTTTRACWKQNWKGSWPIKRCCKSGYKLSKRFCRRARVGWIACL